MSRKKSEQEIQNFFLANFTQTFDPQGVWIGLIIDSGEKTYTKWSEQMDNLFEVFKSNADRIVQSMILKSSFLVRKVTHQYSRNISQVISL